MKKLIFSFVVCLSLQFIACSEDESMVPLNADFSVSNSSPNLGEEIQFLDRSEGEITSWQWSFPGGDPGSSTEENPKVTYANTGVYDVTLTIRDANTLDIVTKTDYIHAKVWP